MEKGNKMKVSPRLAYIIGIVGVVLTLAMAGSVVYFRDLLRELEQYGYLGAFIVSVLGGATYLIPVPMLAVIFAMGGVVKFTWLLGIINGLGETVGALTIYMTGHGAGTAVYQSQHGKIQALYDRLMRLMESKGSITLFLLAAVLNPFFYPAALAAGALRFGVKRYFFICWAGKTVKGLTVAYAGLWGIQGLLRFLGAPV